jgi:FixJ family two-component response regulator
VSHHYFERINNAGEYHQTVKPGIMYKQGVREFLSKPIDQERLLGAVEKAVNEGERRDKFAT